MIRRSFFGSLFLVCVMVLVTPAFAISMEEVAHHAEKYNEESKKKHGFFGKMKLIAKGFKLIDEAQKAGKEGGKKHGKISDKDVFKASNQKIKDRKVLLGYRNRNLTINSTNIVNQTSNNTNSTDNTTVANSTVTHINSVLPNCCISHIDGIINFLTSQGHTVSYTKDNSIEELVGGEVVQIIDSKGYLRYTQILKIDSEGVKLNTGSGEQFYSMDEFTKAYTGINLKTDTEPNTILNSITTKEKDDLNQENNKVKHIHDHARTQIIIWGIITGVATVLACLGFLTYNIFIILIFGGIDVAGAVETTINGIKLRRSNIVAKRNKEDNSWLNHWLTNSNTTQIPENSTSAVS